MKVTRLGPPQSIINSGLGANAGSRIPGGGNDLQVLTSNGSNGRYWGENVRRITSNGSNILASPDVNFVSGSNIFFSVASNSLTISGQAGGGFSLTANGSNTLTGTVNLQAGVGIALGVSGQNVTITNTGVPGPAGAGGGGSGSSIPDVVQIVPAGNQTTSMTIVAAASGHSLIMLTDSTTGQVTSPSCTNVTWTALKQIDNGSAFLTLWVGVVAGGSSGTSITMTKPGTFNTVQVLEVTDALTPTMGANGSLIVTPTNAVLSTLRVGSPTSGRLVVFATGTANTLATQHVIPSVPSAGQQFGIGVAMSVGYATSQALTMAAGMEILHLMIVAEVT